MYRRARLYTYESRRISGYTTGAEISFIYPRLPASLLTVYPQHLVHHGHVRIQPWPCVSRVYTDTHGSFPLPLCPSLFVFRCRRDSTARGRYAILFTLMNFFGRNSVRSGGMQTYTSPWKHLSRRGSLNALARSAQRQLRERYAAYKCLGRLLYAHERTCMRALT